MPFAIPEIRAMIRVFIVLIPAMLFYYQHGSAQSFYDYFLLRKHWVYGAVLGTVITCSYFFVVWFFQPHMQSLTFELPSQFYIWFNFIVGSPLVEELFFRGVLFRELDSYWGRWLAILVSSIVFALFHLPQWLFLDGQTGMTLWSSFVSICVYGIIFAMLVTYSKSLWASLSSHWINNLILLSLN